MRDCKTRACRQKAAAKYPDSRTVAATHHANSAWHGADRACGKTVVTLPEPQRVAAVLAAHLMMPGCSGTIMCMAMSTAGSRTLRLMRQSQPSYLWDRRRRGHRAYIKARGAAGWGSEKGARK